MSTDRAGTSRRAFLSLTVGTAAVLAAACASREPAVEPNTTKAKRGLPSTSKHNMIFVFTDQERYFGEWPSGMSLPGRERLQSQGVTFHQHYCPAVMCTSSRSVILTGLQTADNKMFENVDLPYMKALDPAVVPTVGHMLRKAGYYTAYKGKWHINKEFETERPDRLFTQEMEAYGFSDYIWPGDVLTHALGGYNYDNMIAGSAVSWLRNTGRPLADEGKPWALFVSLVNPHDIMYFNSDAPGEHVQDTGKLLMHAARAPENVLYEKTWGATLPASLKQSMTEPGRPAAHGEFLKAWGHTLGTITPEEERWQRFSDFYLNSIRSVDQQLEVLLGELDALRLTDGTIVVFTSDHGEMGGAHGLRGKGPFAYQQNIHLPMHFVHPDVAGGQDCQALSGHIDLAPTLLAFAGIARDRVGEVAGRELPGADLSPALGDPRSAGLHTVRDNVLFTYSGLATNDSEVIRIAAEAKAAGQNPQQGVQAAGYKPDLRKRGSLRTVFDGRYKFTRYFAPTERNVPRTLDELYEYNDVELFDLEADPDEMTNLAANKGDNAALVLASNAKLESAIRREIGADDGREMPQFDNIRWTISWLDL